MCLTSRHSNTRTTKQNKADDASTVCDAVSKGNDFYRKIPCLPKRSVHSNNRSAAPRAEIQGIESARDSSGLTKPGSVSKSDLAELSRPPICVRQEHSETEQTKSRSYATQRQSRSRKISPRRYHRFLFFHCQSPEHLYQFSLRSSHHPLFGFGAIWSLAHDQQSPHLDDAY
jgi:hypothetical protein